MGHERQPQEEAPLRSAACARLRRWSQRLTPDPAPFTLHWHSLGACDWHAAPHTRDPTKCRLRVQPPPFLASAPSASGKNTDRVWAETRRTRASATRTLAFGAFESDHLSEFDPATLNARARPTRSPKPPG